MDIAGLSMSMASNNLQTKIGTAEQNSGLSMS